MKKYFPILMLMCCMTGISSAQSPVEKETAPVRMNLYTLGSSLRIGEIDLRKVSALTPDGKDQPRKKTYEVSFDSDAMIVNVRLSNEGALCTKKTPFTADQDGDGRIVAVFSNPPESMYVHDQNTVYRVPLKISMMKDNSPELEKDYYRYHWYSKGGNNAWLLPGELSYRMIVAANRIGLGSSVSANLRENSRRERTSGIFSMMELSSGALAIEGSLQLSVMRDTDSGRRSGEKNIETATLKVPELVPHDFTAMTGGKKYKTGDIEEYVPNDMIYVRFASMGNLFECMNIFKLIQNEIPVLTDAVSWKDDTQNKILTQLAIKSDPDMHKFAGLAVKEAGFVFADPYVMEGSDLALVFNLRNVTLFKKQMQKWRKQYAAEFPGTSDHTILYQGYEVSAFTSPDGRIRSYVYFEDDAAVFSTSEWMTKKTIDTKSGALKSVAANLDYHYLLQQTKGPGDAFIYLGDDFIARAISPGFKIAEMRRVNCEANMKLLSYARTFAGDELKENISSIEALIAKGYLSARPECGADGEYSISENGDVCCSKHGRLANLNVLSMNKTEMISAEEASAYKNFADNYHNYWRRYIDPVGIRFDLGDTVSMRTIILPLMNHPQYKTLQHYLGGSPVSFDALSIGNENVIMHAAVKLKVFDDYKSDLSHLSDEKHRRILREISDEIRKKNPEFTDDPFKMFGSEADFFIIEDDSRRESGRFDFGDLKFLLERLVCRIRIKDIKLAEKAVPAILNSYGKGYTVRQESGGTLYSTGLEFNFLLRPDGLWMTQKGNLNAILDGKTRRALSKIINVETTKANLEFGFHPGNMRSSKEVLSRMSSVKYAQICSKITKNIFDISSFSDPLLVLRENEMMKYISERGAACPLGGIYSCSGGRILCSIHGAEGSVNTETPLMKAFNRLKSIVIDMRFTEDGLDTQVFFKNPAR